jgi:uncharacterized protein YgiM (DUF1202 family)
VAAVGHSFGEWYEKVAPTAQTEGEARRDCVRCDHHETKVLPVNPHVYGEWYVHTAPTCTAPGEERRNCSHCDQYESRAIAVTNHSYGEWTVSVVATCVTAGQERRDCTACDHFETREGQLGDHSYGEWYASGDATCVTPGQEKRDCKLCDHFETKETALGEHSFGQWYVSVVPGCEVAGQERRDCAHCEHYESRELSAVGHSLGQWYISGSPDCENSGSQCRDCINCEYIESRPIAALGHSFDQWYVTKEATTTQVGEERRDCTTCGHYETRETEKLPVTVRVYGTFSGSGYLNIREGAGTGYSSVGRLLPGVRVEILEQKDVNGTLWGRIESGWICITGNVELEYENVTYISITRLYATVTASSLYIYQEADSDATQLGTINLGSAVLILEIRTIDGKEWGRTADGWICLTGATTLSTAVETVETGTSIRMYATVTCRSLNVREDANAAAKYLGALKKGAVVEILEIKTVNGANWGRTANGWMCLSGNTTLMATTETQA